MARNLKFLINLGLLSSLLILSACKSGTPTSAADAVYTSAASTVQAELTAHPRTAVPTQTEFVFKTATTAGTLPPVTTPLPTQSQATAPAGAPSSTPAVPDRAAWVSQSPADNSQVVAGTRFKMVWTVQNIGTTQWTTSYQLRFWADEKFGSPASVNLPRQVGPNEQVDITVELTAPNSTGDYHGIWVLTTAEGTNFYPLDVQLKVVNAPTQTPGPSVTPTSESSPTPTVTVEASDS